MADVVLVAVVDSQKELPYDKGSLLLGVVTFEIEVIYQSTPFASLCYEIDAFFI
jgi:hypothetical protein